MAIISDIYNLDGSTPSSTVPTRPNVGMFDMIRTAVDKPSVTFGAAYRTILDKAEAAKEFSPEELASMYPDAPEGTFKQRNTRRMGEWLYKRAVNDDLFEAQNMIRSLDDSAMYNTISGIGYDLLKETSPTDIALAVATAGIVNGLAKVAQVSKIAGVANMGRTLMASESATSATVKAILAREAAEGLVQVPFEYAMMRQLSKYTQEKYGIEDAVLNTIGGTVVSSAMRLGFRSLKPSRILDKIDPTESKRLKNGLQDFYDEMYTKGITDPHDPPPPPPPSGASIGGRTMRERYNDRLLDIFNERLRTQTDLETSMIGKFSDIDILRNLDTDSAIKYKVYNFSTRNLEVESRLQYSNSNGVRMYALFNSNSSMSSNGLNPFGRSVQVNSNPYDTYGFSAVLNIGGDVVELNPNQFKMFNTLDSAEDLGLLDRFLKTAGIGDENSTLADRLKILRNGDNELMEVEVQEFLKSKGYDGIILEDVDNILDQEYRRINGFIFDGIAGADKNVLDTLDGNTALLAENYIYDLEKTKRQKIVDGEAVFSNGKSIKMNADGYFDTDPFYGAPHRGIGYVEMFSKDHIDSINRNIELNRIKNIKKKFQSVTDDMVNYLKDLKSYKELLQAESDLEEEIFSEKFKVEKGFEKVYDKIAKGEHKETLAKIKAEEKTKRINNKQIANKSVEQLNVEGKATRILEQADLEGRINKLNTQINNRLDEQGFVKKGKQNQVDALIREYEDKLKYLQDNNPDVAEEIAKQADYCLRINS